MQELTKHQFYKTFFSSSLMLLQEGQFINQVVGLMFAGKALRGAPLGKDKRSNLLPQQRQWLGKRSIKM
jgi:hypothetical protein